LSLLLQALQPRWTTYQPWNAAKFLFIRSILWPFCCCCVCIKWSSSQSPKRSVSIGQSKSSCKPCILRMFWPAVMMGKDQENTIIRWNSGGLSFWSFQFFFFGLKCKCCSCYLHDL
jgi:hypothetical protein